MEFIQVKNRCLNNVIPADAHEVNVEMSASMSGNCLPDFSTEDPFVSLELNVIVLGKTKKKTRVKCAWHLDRDLKKEGDNESLYVHPLYHFQYGGNEISDLVTHGHHIVLGSPRLPHPPLDGILAIDFILSNYYGEYWTKLRHEDEYRQLVDTAQKRFWRSYSFSLASRWHRTEPKISEWDYKTIYPRIAEAH